MGSSAAAYRTPVFIGLLCVMCFAAVLLLHHCVLVACCRRNRRRRTTRQQQEDGEEEEEEETTMSSSSRVHLVNNNKGGAGAGAEAAMAVYRKEKESWMRESTCPVCLADFADGEPVRVLPECMHYFHGECIDTWLRGSNSCPMCRAETTPTPSHSADLNHHNQFSVSVSLEEILVRTS
ncbi:hypothetical protein PR202_gb13755 [Eleusine coracana subsp. coracana]|uniref:RING-type domain-containing protein n=1 Tax=Eleusine coracana subsp. coracana TaxID=191504 RepID=A0AAV5ERC9_ELECO|nr:hypothetical protein QOZ80_9BG0718900 [Eleusine coracana subsp. coracana]GJN25869.1 hypothetical protein PR202_gb13755 [Eleusine coracana subsp. coracana]